jgi:hypothetical protein
VYKKSELLFIGLIIGIISGEKISRLTASYTNRTHAKNAGPTRESDGLPSARIANVM